MKWRVPVQEVDQRKKEERLWKKTAREDAIDRNKWRKQIRDD